MKKEDSFEALIEKLPEDYRRLLKYLGPEETELLEEIRIKAGEKILLAGGFGEIVSDIEVSREGIASAVDSLLEHSVYAHMDELCSGYVTASGGHRIGICGKAVSENGRIKNIKDFSSLNIRRSREIRGCGEKVKKYIIGRNGEFLNTLVVSPPKCGKTTLLRDIVRQLSEEGFRISLVDERSEIGALYKGIPGHNVGMRTDIMDSCGKQEGIILMVRSMSPDIVCTDEIGSPGDGEAIKEAVKSGVGILTSVHGSEFEELKNSKISELIRERIFERYIFLSAVPEVGTVSGILDRDGKKIYG
ncbi:MAG: stage III sporulation protein AA [Bacillota bacterium]|nr:stage III sporulation protein AA [Bacillota bacterium]